MKKREVKGARGVGRNEQQRAMDVSKGSRRGDRREREGG